MALIKEFRNDMQKKELWLTFSGTAEMPEYYEKTIWYNDIPGVLKFRSDMSDGVRRFVYRADGLRPLTLEYEERKPGFEVLKNLLYDIMEAIEASRCFLISEDDFVICDECIFVDDMGNASVSCLPGYGKNLKSQFSSLFDFFMDKIDYMDKDAVVALYDIYRRSREGECDFEYIRKVFGTRNRARPGTKERNSAEDPAMKEIFAVDRESCEGSDERCEKQCGSVEPEPIGSMGESPVKPLAALFGYGRAQKKKRKSIFAFKSKEESTRLLCVAGPSCILEPVDGEENVRIDKWPFLIGKGDSTHFPDYELAYPQISRIHARIMRDPDGDICVEDMRSLNGTFVNGKEIRPGVPVKVRDGDAVSFANREYRFILRNQIP